MLAMMRVVWSYIVLSCSGKIANAAQHSFVTEIHRFFLTKIALVICFVKLFKSGPKLPFKMHVDLIIFVFLFTITAI